MAEARCRARGNEYPLDSRNRLPAPRESSLPRRRVLASLRGSSGLVEIKATSSSLQRKIIRGTHHSEQAQSSKSACNQIEPSLAFHNLSKRRAHPQRLVFGRSSSAMRSNDRKSSCPLSLVQRTSTTLPFRSMHQATKTSVLQ